MAMSFNRKLESVKCNICFSTYPTLIYKTLHFKVESAVLKNAKKEKVTVTVQEPISGDWKILSESHPHSKANSHLAVWKIDVPAEGSTTLTYRAQVKY